MWIFSPYWPILATLASLSAAQTELGWSYVESKNGSSYWPRLFPICGGNHQSPVDLPGDNPKHRALLPVFLFHGPTVDPSAVKFKLVTNEHTLKLIIPPNSFFFSLRNYRLEDYTVYEIVFHWGSNDSDGSEHRIHGKAYSMESQIMGFKTMYKTKELALNMHDGIAGVSILHEACTDVTKQETGIGLMGGLEETIRNTLNKSRRAEMPYFDLTRLLTIVDHTRFYRYSGSLTSPPCTESVIWTVYKETAPILPSQLQLFRTIRDVVGDKEYLMANNYRLTVPLNTEDNPMPRKIYSSLNAGSRSQVPYSALLTIVLGFILNHIKL